MCWRSDLDRRSGAIPDHHEDDNPRRSASHGRNDHNLADNYHDATTGGAQGHPASGDRGTAPGEHVDNHGQEFDGAVSTGHDCVRGSRWHSGHASLGTQALRTCTTTEHTCRCLRSA